MDNIPVVWRPMPLQSTLLIWRETKACRRRCLGILVEQDALLSKLDTLVVRMWNQSEAWCSVVRLFGRRRRWAAMRGSCWQFTLELMLDLLWVHPLRRETLILSREYPDLLSRFVFFAWARHPDGYSSGQERLGRLQERNCFWLFWSLCSKETTGSARSGTFFVCAWFFMPTTGHNISLNKPHFRLFASGNTSLIKFVFAKFTKKNLPNNGVRW